MIQSIDLQGFRGIREGVLIDFSPLVVLVGPNGCGKSTILDAIAIAGGQFGPSSGIGFVVKRHAGVEMGAPWLLWRMGQDPEVVHRIVLKTDYPSERSCELAPKQSSDGTEFSILCTTATKVTKAPPSQPVTTSTTFRWRNDYDVDRSTGIMPLPGVSELRLLDVPPSGLRQPLHELYSTAVVLGRRTEAKKMLADVVPGISDVEILTERDTPIVHLVFETHSVPAALAGDGIHSLLRIVLEIASRQGGIILIEEPEVHKHPGAIRQTARVIWSAVRRGMQIFVTTHSLELIDALLAGASEQDLARFSLYRLRLQEGVLRCSRMCGQDVAFARAEIEDDLR